MGGTAVGRQYTGGCLREGVKFYGRTIKNGRITSVFLLQVGIHFNKLSDFAGLLHNTTFNRAKNYQF